MILVSGAAGKTGLAVIAALSQEGQAVRAIVKDATQEARVREAGAVEVVAGDMSRAEVWQTALEDISAVYHVAPNMHAEEVLMGRIALSRAQTVGVGHFVYHSVLHPQTATMPHHWNKLRVEEMIFESGLPFTILQPAAYMQNILAGWRKINVEGVYRVPYPVLTRLSLVDLGDVAQVAARVLTEPGHVGATYELVGTQPLAQTEVAELLAEALSRPVEAREVALEEWREEAKEAGTPEHAMEALLKMFRYYAAYGFVGNPRVLTWLLGRQPRGLPELAAGWRLETGN